MIDVSNLATLIVICEGDIRNYINIHPAGIDPKWRINAQVHGRLHQVKGNDVDQCAAEIIGRVDRSHFPQGASR